MRYVATLNGSALYKIDEVGALDWEARYPKNMLGVPVFVFQSPEGGVHLWPAPIEGCEIFKLEPASWVKE